MQISELQPEEVLPASQKSLWSAHNDFGQQHRTLIIAAREIDFLRVCGQFS